MELEDGKQGYSKDGTIMVFFSHNILIGKFLIEINSMWGFEMCKIPLQAPMVW